MKSMDWIAKVSDGKHVSLPLRSLHLQEKRLNILNDINLNISIENFEILISREIVFDFFLVPRGWKYYEIQFNWIQTYDHMTYAT